MKGKIRIIFLVTLMITVMMFTGCGKKEVETEQVVSEAVENVEETVIVEEAVTEEIVEVEPVEPVEDIVETDIVEGTALTQAELDQLKANAKDDWAKENVEIYEDITSGGTWTGDNGGTYDKVVGTPDNSWRRMTDAEAQDIISKGPDAEGYKAAQAELEGTSWAGFDGSTGTIYFDYYAYAERMAELSAEVKADPQNQPIEILDYEENKELIDALMGKPQ